MLYYTPISAESKAKGWSGSLRGGMLMYFTPKDTDGAELGTVPEPEKLAEGEHHWSGIEPDDDDQDSGGKILLSPTSKRIHSLATRAGVEPEALIRLMQLDTDRPCGSGSGAEPSSSENFHWGHQSSKSSKRSGSKSHSRSTGDPAIAAATETDCPKPAVKFVSGPLADAGGDQVSLEGGVGSVDRPETDSLLSKEQSGPGSLTRESSPIRQRSPQRLSPGRLAGRSREASSGDIGTTRRKFHQCWMQCQCPHSASQCPCSVNHHLLLYVDMLSKQYVHYHLLLYVDMLSKQYAVLPEDLWNPHAAGATRPGSGRPWDYQTAVYNPQLVREGDQISQIP